MKIAINTKTNNAQPPDMFIHKEGMDIGCKNGALNQQRLGYYLSRKMLNRVEAYAPPRSNLFHR